MGRLKGSIPKHRRKGDRLEHMFNRHSAHMTTVCKFWRPNPQWQVPPVMAGENEKDGVMCDSFSSCETCGWNPEVHKKRMKEILRCP